LRNREKKKRKNPTTEGDCCPRHGEGEESKKSHGGNDDDDYQMAAILKKTRPHPQKVRQKLGREKPKKRNPVGPAAERPVRRNSKCKFFRRFEKNKNTLHLGLPQEGTRKRNKLSRPWD